MSTFIIAEAGVNHNGDTRIAKKLIGAAKEIGADAVKFQTFKAGKVVTPSTAKARYQKENMKTDESQLEMLMKLELNMSEHEELFDYCKTKGIMFMSTPFDEASVDMLDDLGVELFKIPSGEITNKSLIEYMASKNKPLIMSTGMSYLGEVESAIGWIQEQWKDVKQIPKLTLLHCVSNYPAPMEGINLSAMNTMEKAFGLPVGFSDHTLGVEASLAAVALGAQVIEKHLTLNRNMDGPDHQASLEPNEFNGMIKAIRNIESAIGDGVKSPTIHEQEMRDVARRSLIATRDLKEGEALSLGDISAKRPGLGIPPKFKEEIVGMQLRRNISADTLLQWEDLKNNA